MHQFGARFFVRAQNFQRFQHFKHKIYGQKMKILISIFEIVVKYILTYISHTLSMKLSIQKIKICLIRYFIISSLNKAKFVPYGLIVPKLYLESSFRLTVKLIFLKGSLLPRDMSSEIISVCQICWNISSHKTNPTLTHEDKTKRDKNNKQVSLKHEENLFKTSNNCWNLLSPIACK